MILTDVRVQSLEEVKPSANTEWVEESDSLEKKKVETFQDRKCKVPRQKGTWCVPKLKRRQCGKEEI